MSIQPIGRSLREFAQDLERRYGLALTSEKRTPRASDFRDGDIVEVVGKHGYRGYGVVDSREAYRRCSRYDPVRVSLATFVYVRKLEGQISTGGWYPEQCRLVIRPPARRGLPVPDNITLGEN